jgi:isoleucyl-tRNA synthetase
VDTYVTDKDGTGIVHQAPAFGEDDHRIALAYEVIDADEMPPCPIDDAGRFTSDVPDFAGQYVKVSTLRNISYDGRGAYTPFISPGCGQGNHESAQGKGPARETGSGKTSVSILLEVGPMTRIMMISLPDCRADRSNTPIIYRAFPVWNVRVSHIVGDLVKNNSETRWFVAVLIHRCADLNSLFAGYRPTSVRIDSETGSPMHATGLFLVTVIGAPRSRCGSLMTLKKYDSHPF